MSEFRSTIFFTVLVIFVGTVLIAVWHSLGGVTESGVATSRPSAHLIPAPDAAEIPTAGMEYEVSLTAYEHIDIGLSTRALRFSGLRTGETTVGTGHECETVAVREVLVSREGSDTTITARLDRDEADASDRSVYFRLIGPGTTLTETALATGFQDTDTSDDYNEGDLPAAAEVSVQWENLVGGQPNTVFASTDAGYPSHQTRGTAWTVGIESEAVRDPVVASRVHAPAGSYVTLAPCRAGSSAELLLIDGESITDRGEGGETIRAYRVETTP